MSDEKLILRFDPNTIEHLGVSLYSKLPNVLAELVSNSWDADATEVTIEIHDTGSQKEIVYRDNGLGMTFQELNEKYLFIGRNRRDQGEDVTPSGRKVIGKKGLGKLSVFGICNEIEVRTVKEGVENSFKMNIHSIKDSRNSEYYPDILVRDRAVDPKGRGTTIVLRDIRRKSSFDIEEIELSIAKRFVIFDQISVCVTLNGAKRVPITNEQKYSGFPIEFEWLFPKAWDDIDYRYAKRFSGRIVTLKTPIKDAEMKGIYLTSRGKIVNSADFYGIRDTDQFHTYVTGYLEVDFIDEFADDVISTDRQSLNWETDDTRALQQYLQQIIRKIGAEWRKNRARVKNDTIKSVAAIDIDSWQKGLLTADRKLSERIVNPILENPDLGAEESARVIKGVIDKFENQTYREYAARIADLEAPEQIPALLGLLEEWKAVETRQLSDIAVSRIHVIQKFEEYLDSDTREVPTLHNFLKQFSWLLDPRILEFRDEVTYSRILKETYPEETLDITDRRIDFLCSNALGGILYVVEIKRSRYKIDAKAIEQAYEYNSFLRSKYGSTTGFSKVVCFVVGGQKSDDALFKSKEETYMKTSEVFVKTYYELLEQSKQFHREFIDAYKKENQ